MLNATNRTLSANSTRLNLGTRNLALVASLNDGTTLRLRRHDRSHHMSMVESVRVEVTRVAPRPSIQPVPPKPIGGGGFVVGPKRGTLLGSSRSSSRRSLECARPSVQGLFSRFGFSAFDLAASSDAQSWRSGDRLKNDDRPTPRTRPTDLQGQAGPRLRYRATQPALAYAEAYAGRLEQTFLEPSAAS